MRLIGLQVNGIQFTSFATTVEVGYYYKPSEDEFCDDLTMGHTAVQVPNSEIVPLLDGIVEHFRDRFIDAAWESVRSFNTKAATGGGQ